jgi:U3 small nucleolar ribonucleoprotein component
LKKSSTDSSSNNKFENKFKYKSLFDLRDDDIPSPSSGDASSSVDQSSDSAKKLNESITNIFKILDVFSIGYISFDSFFTFYKYLRTFEVLNTAESNEVAVISSKKLSGKL